jgi:hypothetical protein
MNTLFSKEYISHTPYAPTVSNSGLGPLHKLAYFSMLRDTKVPYALQWGRPFKCYTIIHYIRADKETNSEKCKLQKLKITDVDF